MCNSRSAVAAAGAGTTGLRPHNTHNTAAQSLSLSHESCHWMTDPEVSELLRMLGVL